MVISTLKDDLISDRAVSNVGLFVGVAVIFSKPCRCAESSLRGDSIRHFGGALNEARAAALRSSVGRHSPCKIVFVLASCCRVALSAGSFKVEMSPMVAAQQLWTEHCNNSILNSAARCRGEILR